jgi:hypothetical protein
VRRPYIVLTLGSPPEKGEKKKKKTLVPIWVSGPRLSGPGQTKKTKQKKNPGINHGQPAGKGRKKKKPWAARRKRAEKKNPGPDLGFRTTTFKT